MFLVSVERLMVLCSMMLLSPQVWNMVYESPSIFWASNSTRLQGIVHLLRSPVAEKVIYLILVLISLIIHEMIHHGNHGSLRGWKHS